MAEVSAFKPGIGARTYRNTGSYGSPTWTAQVEHKDVTLAMPWDWVEAGTRATRAKLFGKARTDITVTIVCKADDEDADYENLINAAFLPTTVVDLLVLNGLISVEGVRGVRAEFLVNLDSEPQMIDDSIYPTFTLKPTFTTNGYPGTVVMAASSTPTITAL